MTGAPASKGQLHYALYLCRVHLAEGTAHNRKVLGVDEDEPSVDGSVASYDAVSRQFLLVEAELSPSVLYEHSYLDEASWVEELFNPLPGSELTLFVLLFDAFSPPISRIFFFLSYSS